MDGVKEVEGKNWGELQDRTLQGSTGKAARWIATDEEAQK